MNTCETCKANKVCDHNKFGFENCGSYNPEWISVEERLPTESRVPILVTDGATVIIAYKNWLYRSNSTGKLRCPAKYGNGIDVTHWMPLPKPPKGE